MGYRRHDIIFTIIFTASIYQSYGCQIEGMPPRPAPLSLSIQDIFRGTVFENSYSGIDGINTINFGEGLQRGPYLDINLDESRFVITTSDAYEDYEEYETTNTFSVTVTCRCTGGSSQSFVFILNIIDTNNNAPRFIPSNDLVYTVTAPIPPRSQIPGDLVVRDIDLTTQRIIFTVDSDDFEVELNTSVPKEFRAIIRNNKFIRRIPEPITFTVNATDVDLTGDPPLTTSATITIMGDDSFELPDEPVFSKTFYLAEYTDEHQFILSEPISLRQGYDEQVEFYLEKSAISDNFKLVKDGNQVSIEVVTPLTIDNFRESNIFLVVRASRAETSGDSATIVVQLPEEVLLEFERAYYEGTIEKDVLQISPLILSQGYEGAVVSVAVNDYQDYFNASVQGNTIILSMTSLDESVVNANSFITLHIVAFTDRSTASTIVTLEIIKDDNITPVFNRDMYTGTYSPDIGLTLQQIELIQGYDGSITLALGGAYSGHFRASRNGSIITLDSDTIPPEIFPERHITVTLQANKPRTVGANAAIVITLPAARELSFASSTYRGRLQDNVLNIEPILLTSGYDYDVRFALSGDYDAYFSIHPELNKVTIQAESVPSSVILENNVILLTLTASGVNALTTTTSILVDIIKDDKTTPVFARNVYNGKYLDSNINMENITLTQGYDNNVTFRLYGEHADYFRISNTDDNIQLFLRSAIPEDVIFTEKVLVFNILAEKPFTVGANAAISITFPPELTEPTVMRFSQNTYIGTIENKILRVDDIVLSEGYATGNSFILTGDYSAYFNLTSNNNIASLSLLNSLPDTIEKTFIVLEIEARREKAVSVWTSIVIDIIKQEIVSPMFTEPYYRGFYNTESGLKFGEIISLQSGYDETVTFRLEGEMGSLFLLDKIDDNLFSISFNSMPDNVLENNSHLLFTVVAIKPNAATARAVISIDIEREIIDKIVLRFAQNNYVGVIENSILDVPTITLLGDITEDVSLRITGDYEQHFNFTRNGNDVKIQLVENLPIPDNVITENAFIMLEIVATASEAINGYTTVVIEIIKEEIITPVFERAYYAGEYSDQDGLLFVNSIRLIQGFDQTVSFALEGEDSQWFETVKNGENNVTLSLKYDKIQVDNRNQLVFSIVASKPGSLAVRAALVITLLEFTDSSNIGFDRVTYVGTIQNDLVDLGPITIVEGYTDDVALSLHGELSSFFNATRQGPVVNVELRTPIPASQIPPNKIILLELRASAQQTGTTYATIVFEVIVEDDAPSVVQPVFDSPYYTGSYSATDGILLMETPITLSEGYDESVEFDLEGEHRQYFSLDRNQNSVRLIVTSAIPSAILANNRQLILVVTAQRPGSFIARTTIVISLTDEFTDSTNIGFDRVTYVGTIQNDLVDLGPITIVEGYTDDVALSLHGELSSFFNATRQGPIINVELRTPIPASQIPPNKIILLEIRASAQQTGTTYATIVFEVIVEDDAPSLVQPVFDSPYYTGSYSATDGILLMETPITLSEGYDDSVEFDLEGEHRQYFSLDRNQNSVRLIVTSAIPSAILANNRQLILVVTAQRPGSVIARTTIVISLTDEFTDSSNIGFDRVTYVGTIQNDLVDLGPITIVEGYTDDVALSLHGELSSFFNATRQGPIINVELRTPIPASQIPPNKIILLEIHASAQQTSTTYATIVFEVIVEDDAPSVVQPVFDSPYYTGSYSATDGILLMETPITLSEGYDDSVEFDLEGEHRQYFSLDRNQNSVRLIVTSAIPSAILANNRQLILVVTAQRPGSVIARTTIVISLTDEFTDSSNIGFDRVTYVGTIQNDLVDLGPITIVEGYTEDVALSLHGELSSFFNATRQGPIINMELRTPIPASQIPPNKIILLEIRASAQQTGTAYATIVFEVIVEDDAPSVVQPVFDSPYYTGSYSATDGILLMETPITLSEGYHDSVEFDLEGEHRQYFSLDRNQNSVRLIVTNAIPSAILVNNRQLILVVTAQRPGSVIARTTIVISLTDEFTDSSNIGFDRVTYVGTIQNDLVDLGPITIVEGYTDDVALSLHGELSSFFNATRQGPIINVELRTPIPASQIPPNKIILLEIRASAQQTGTTYTTIVFEVIVEDDAPSVVQPVFDSSYYTGSYSATDGILLMETPITLSEGYDDSVEFDLEGEHRQYFSLDRNQNSVRLIVTSAIPSAILANNRQLILVVTAQRPGSVIARTTIVISLTDEFTDSSNIGFDRVTYVGTIQNDLVDLGPITIVEGYTDDVALSLHGELSSFFNATRQGPIINVELRTPIPASQIPPNKIILLEIRASAQQTGTTYATIVFEVIVEDDAPSVVQPVFDSPYYTGSYSATDGILLMETPITLSEGYDDSVEFDLEGEHRQYFSLDRNQNSVRLIVTSAIPSAILANNRQLILVVTAQRPGSVIARTTIVISLTDEFTDSTNIGFDRVTYVGTIQNDLVDLGPITIVEGYTDDVALSLHGELSSFFNATRQGPIINVELRTPISASQIPPNKIILLEIRASAQQTGTTYATIVFEVIVEDDAPSVVQPVFDSPYYTGSYSATDGILLMETPITLSEGYHDSIEFDLEGEHRQYFSLDRNQNSVRLIVTSAIPSAILANNRQLILVVTAQRPGSVIARTTIVISLTVEFTDSSNIGFDRVTYVGTIQNDLVDLGPITIVEGYTDDVALSLHGELSSFFNATRQGPIINVELRTPIPASQIPPNKIILLEIRASAQQTGTTYATIVFEVIVEDDAPSVVQPVFDSPYYTGSYSATDGILLMETPITLSEGYHDSVEFDLEGEHRQYFSLDRNQNSVRLIVTSAIPSAILANNRQFILVVTAQRPGSVIARTTIVISLTDEFTDSSNIGFDRVTYVGTIQNDLVDLGPITIVEGYTDEVALSLHGELSSFFNATRQGPIINVELRTPIPASQIPPNKIILLELRASAQQTGTTYATLVFEVIVEDDAPSVVQPVFDSPYYTGSYSATDSILLMETPITLSEGYHDSIEFDLEGEHRQYFSLDRNQNSVRLIVNSAIPSAILANNRQLMLVITAQRPGSVIARATIVITLTVDFTENSNIGFDRVTYIGTIQNDLVDLAPITIVEGYTDDVELSLHGELSGFFNATRQGPVVNVELRIPIPDSQIPPNNIILLEIRASSQQTGIAHSTIVFEIIVEDNAPSVVQPVFDSPYYTGSYNATDGILLMETPITLSEGYDDSVLFDLEGEHRQYFSLDRNQNSVRLIVTSAIPNAILTNNRQIVLVVTAQRPGSVIARATIVISLADASHTGDDISFDKVLYEGIIQKREVLHEIIMLTGDSGTNVDIFGEYSSLFMAHVADGIVSVEKSGSMTLPNNVGWLSLELHASAARAVLLLNVAEADVPILPTVYFSSPSYVLNVEIVQTGLIGVVSATASNGEAITYSLNIDNAHLLSRLSVNNEGEMHLSAPANSGVYAFRVIATSVITQTTGTATVHLTVTAVTVCEDDIVVPPLIILDRDEEEPHTDLVPLKSTEYEGCHFSLTNRWPINQTWLYVDENGLHTKAIDREHESIAFMALSQVQVELILHCESDTPIRTKRFERSDWLGPYDYGTNKWILTDTILFNSRRSLVNLIVNDINDNSPIFVGKEHEPIVVGYPIEDLVERILPRSLAELKATDADIGENAAIRYWSSSSALAVAPTTGFVHVSKDASLQDNQILSVNATDRNGEGLTGSIQLMVKLLDLNNIAVVTVKDAFLDNETEILADLSDAVGYALRSLRSVVISDDIDEDVTRKKRETGDTTGTSLRLYVYGLIERQPVVVDQLAKDINDAASVGAISAISLEDHLNDNQIIVHLGLLVATIVLSVLLFILILLIAIWFFLRWCKGRNYDEFSDESSIASRNVSQAELPKPDLAKPRLNIDDLKRSERRLQEMLNAPGVTVEPTTSRKETPIESILDLPSPELNAPIVIQSIDKLKNAEDSEDEFGEVKASSRRKSVVTFNENVERIIHVEDEADDSNSGYEIYKL